MIYFARATGTDFVKIGKAKNVKRRILTLRTSSAFDIQSIHEEEGDTAREAELHKQFSHYRVRGEWFALGADLVAYLSERGVSVEASESMQVSLQEAEALRAEVERLKKELAHTKHRHRLAGQILARVPMSGFSFLTESKDDAFGWVREMGLEEINAWRKPARA